MCCGIYDTDQKVLRSSLLGSYMLSSNFPILPPTPLVALNWGVS